MGEGPGEKHYLRLGQQEHDPLHGKGHALQVKRRLLGRRIQCSLVVARLDTLLK